MDPSEMVLRFTLGGLVVLIASLIAETEHWLYSGLALLFPAVTIVGFYFMYYSADPEQFRQILLYTLLSVPTIFSFVLGIYIGHSWVRGSASYSLGLGMFLWVLTAIIINIIYKSFILN